MEKAEWNSISEQLIFERQNTSAEYINANSELK